MHQRLLKITLDGMVWKSAIVSHPLIEESVAVAGHVCQKHSEGEVIHPVSQIYALLKNPNVPELGYQIEDPYSESVDTKKKRFEMFTCFELSSASCSCSTNCMHAITVISFVRLANHMMVSVFMGSFVLELRTPETLVVRYTPVCR